MSNWNGPYSASDDAYHWPDRQSLCTCCRHNGEACICSCHRMSRGPRQPLDEKQAEIDRLRTMLLSLTRYVRVNVLPGRDGDLALKTIVAQAEYTAEKTWAERT